MDATLNEKLAIFLVLIGSLSVHEWAHAWVADKLGDITPRSQGRVTLNPLAHIDILGTVIIPLTLILLTPGFAVLGWGRPVMINPRNFKNPMWGDIISSMAGPVANLILAALTATVFGLWVGVSADPQTAAKAAMLGINIIMLNTMLSVFNLLPIPPLDGSHILRYIFRMTELAFIRYAQWGSLILIVLINFSFFQNFLGRIINYCSLPFLSIMDMVAGAAHVALNLK